MNTPRDGVPSLFSPPNSMLGRQSLRTPPVLLLFFLHSLSSLAAPSSVTSLEGHFRNAAASPTAFIPTNGQVSSRSSGNSNRRPVSLLETGIEKSKNSDDNNSPQGEGDGQLEITPQPAQIEQPPASHSDSPIEPLDEAAGVAHSSNAVEGPTEGSLRGSAKGSTLLARRDDTPSPSSEAIVGEEGKQGHEKPPLNDEADNTKISRNHRKKRRLQYQLPPFPRQYVEIVVTMGIIYLVQVVIDLIRTRKFRYHASPSTCLMLGANFRGLGETQLSKYARFLTSIWLHAHPIHLVCNVLALSLAVTFFLAGPGKLEHNKWLCNWIVLVFMVSSFVGSFYSYRTTLKNYGFSLGASGGCVGVVTAFTSLTVTVGGIRGVQDVFMALAIIVFSCVPPEKLCKKTKMEFLPCSCAGFTHYVVNSFSYVYKLVIESDPFLQKAGEEKQGSLLCSY